MKTLIGTSLSAAALLGAMLVAAPVNAQQAMSMDQLLRAVEKGRVQDNKEAQEREAKFRAARADQERLLKEAQAEKAAAENRSVSLEAQTEENKTHKR